MIEGRDQLACGQITARPKDDNRARFDQFFSAVQPANQKFIQIDVFRRIHFGEDNEGGCR
jgi:hypothetical protein